MTGLEILVRSMLRKTGILGVISGVPRRLESRRYRSQYRRQLPREVDVQLQLWRAKMLVSSETEYTMIRAKREDYRLMQHLAESLKPGDTFWDIGSNIGFYTVLAAQIVGTHGKVFAFEPEPQSRNRLIENIRLNRLNNVEVVPVGLGSRRDKLHLAAAHDASDGSHRLVQSGEPGRGGVVVEVDVVPGDELRTERNLAVPNAVKIDVEGFELDVLRGMRETLKSSDCRTLLCEVHFAILDSRGQREAPLELERLLRQCGFARLRWIDRSHLLATR